MAGALGHEIRPVIDEQPDLQRALIQYRGGQRVHALPERGTRNGGSADLIGLARPALTAPALAHEVRRPPPAPLARAAQAALQPPRPLPTVLDRPRPRTVEPVRPA